jgi:hypothetical protein
MGSVSIIQWIVMGAQLLPVLGFLLLLVWDGRLPIISEAEVNPVADVLISRYGAQADKIAFLFEEEARRQADSYEQEKWRQIRERIKVLQRDL